MKNKTLFEFIINLKRNRTRYKNLYFKWYEKYENAEENTVERIFYEYKYKLYFGKFLICKRELEDYYGE